MARRNSGAAAQQESTEAVEATVEAPATEAPQAEVKKDEAPIDLTGFQSAVAEALEGADTSTGDIAPAGLESVNKVYRELDGIKSKNQARAWIDEQMKHAISEEKNIVKAKSFVMLKENLSAGSGGASHPRTPADPTQAFVQRVVALRLAYTEVTSTVPEGVSEDWKEKVAALAGELAEQVDSYRTWLNDDSEERGDAPEVSPVVRQAFKLAAGKASGGGSRASGGPRRDVVKHMEQVFENLDSGSFLTVNEIAKAASTEYGDDRPSAGAVSARLFPKGKEPFKNDVIEGFAPEGKPKGARKL